MSLLVSLFKSNSIAHSNNFSILSSTHKIKQTALSIPCYFRELARIRKPSALYAWAYFKFPYLFPLMHFPTYVCIEPTNMCNLSCRHCWRTTMNRPVGAMEIELFEKIVRELSIYSPTLFKIGGNGEPAIHPRFRELMTILAPHSLRVAVYTNGSLLQLFPHHEILSWGLDMIVLSVDGLDADSYEQIKIGSNYARVRQLVEDFYICRNSSGLIRPIIDIRHVIMPNETTTQLLKFRKKWIQTADIVKFNYLEPTTGLSGNEDPFPPRCRQIRRELSINWDGTVPVCGGSKHDFIGNVHRSSISELWRHPKKQYLRRCNLRREFSKVPICMRCCHCR
jgi:MoaA/NifB/PqqE/SkfB family radical SAM enzyme